ncbi:MAG: hypothetical protein HY677_07100, partial [Chloroflexi bacterium]|nr:hypothetical protein [Chloroflexota bacterium]
MEEEAPKDASAPQPGNAELDPERQRKAREYARISRRLFFIDLGIGLAALLLLWLAGLSADLRGALHLPRPALIAAYTTALMAGYGLLLSPLAIYSGYVLPRRYGLSVQSFGGWLFDVIKGGAISFLLGLGAVEGIYWLLQRQPTLWWLWAAIAAFAVSVLLANL